MAVITSDLNRYEVLKSTIDKMESEKVQNTKKEKSNGKAIAKLILKSEFSKSLISKILEIPFTNLEILASSKSAECEDIKIIVCFDLRGKFKLRLATGKVTYDRDSKTKIEEKEFQVKGEGLAHVSVIGIIQKAYCEKTFKKDDILVSGHKWTVSGAQGTDEKILKTIIEKANKKYESKAKSTTLCYALQDGWQNG